MKMRLQIVMGIMTAVVSSAPNYAQTSGAGGLIDDARQQGLDKSFADAENALTVRLLDKAIAHADEDAALLGTVTEAAKSLSDRLTALKTNDEGRRLAATLDVLSAEEVQHLFDQPLISAQEVAANQMEIDSAKEELHKLRSEPPSGFITPEQQQDELFKISVSLRHALAQVRERDNWLTSLISSAPPHTDVSKLPTLEAALADLRSREQRAWNEAQKKGIEEARPEALSQITETARNAELERSLQQSRAMLAQTRSDIELAKIDLDMQLRTLREEKDREVAGLNQRLAQSEAQRSVINAAADATREEGKIDAEKIVLRQKCQDPDVKNLLAPFLALGVWQPGDRMGQPWLGSRGPISLSALTKNGALEPTTRGLTLLYIYTNGKYINSPMQIHPDSERPKWGFDRVPSRLSQSDWQEIKHAQDLLNELGPTMVELGMLGK